MSAADSFLSLFDEQGRYKNGDGEVGAIFLTRSGTEYPVKLRFKSGLLVLRDSKKLGLASGETSGKP